MFFLACVAPDSDSAATDSEALPSACGSTPAGQVLLPADDGAHLESPVEWWYWTGHLHEGGEPVYGFEYVVFLMSYGDERHAMVHRALTDLRADDFVYQANYGDEPAAYADEGFDFALFDSRAVGGDGLDQLDFEVEGRSLSLSLESRKDPVLHHGDGYIDYETGGNSYYYSRSRMEVAGSVDGAAVSGSAWFDHQWGELTLVAAVGWDWYALQLEDGSELMFFYVHDGDETSLAGGTRVDAGCHVSEIAAEDVEILPRGSWTSPATGCSYPMGWDLEVEGEHYGLSPAREDQELDGGYTAYWEGAASIDGTAGRAYVELNGYCD